MEEARRLAYLEALGIQQWVPREPLAGARVSPVVDVQDMAEMVPQTAAARLPDAQPEMAPAIKPAPAQGAAYTEAIKSTLAAKPVERPIVKPASVPDDPDGWWV